MFYYIKMIFKSFYDFGAIKNYVLKGPGTGALLMANLALIGALIFGGLFGFAYSSIEKPDVYQAVSETMKDVPELQIKDGNLVWQDGVIQKFKFADDLFMTVDTFNDSPTVAQMQNSTIYVTTKDLYLNDESQNRIQPISWKEIQDAAGENPLIINKEKVSDGVMAMIDYTRVYVIVLAFAGIWLWFWLGNIILAALTRLFGSTIFSEMKTLEQYQRRRLATIATLPPMVLLDISSYGFGYINGWVRWVAIIVIGVVIMKKYYMAMQATPIEKTSASASKAIARSSVAKKAPAKAKAAPASKAKVAPTPKAKPAPKAKTSPVSKAPAKAKSAATVGKAPAAKKPVAAKPAAKKAPAAKPVTKAPAPKAPAKKTATKKPAKK